MVIELQETWTRSTFEFAAGNQLVLDPSNDFSTVNMLGKIRQLR